MKDFRISFDIGGTFTDLVILGECGKFHVSKCLSQTKSITQSVLDGLDDLIKRESIEKAQIQEVISGATTLVTNLIIERKGAATGLLTTEGFPDLIEIGREIRYDIYDITAKMPEPIIPRSWRKEIVERLDKDGKVVIPLNEDSVRSAINQLVADGVTSIAVCFLHSYLYPAHEHRVKEIAKEYAPNIFISLSSDILPEIREYERTIATSLNAYVRPNIGNYLKDLEGGLSQIGLKASLNIMQSNGGVISRKIAEETPLRMLESGPAAGALAAANVAKTIGLQDILSFDMGGTTAKSCLISGATPQITLDFETSRVQRFKKGSGFPIKLPIIDMMEIGAGGGSIARVDETGLLKVGPDSAGAFPGPACYGLGGRQPTVTDAALLLGYLDPLANLGDQVKLNEKKAKLAVKKFIANPLNVSLIEAASGIYKIVCENMASATKIHAVEKGIDIRRYSLVAFGGAGPMHAREVARRLGCKTIIVPQNAGVFSAVGLLVAPVMSDAVRTHYTQLNKTDWYAIKELYQDMTEQTADALIQTGVAYQDIIFERCADMRYNGQGFEITVTFPSSKDFNMEALAKQAFYNKYDELFGHHLTGVELEVLTWRLRATAPSPFKPAFGDNNSKLTGGLIGYRKVFFPDFEDFYNVPVYNGMASKKDNLLKGPALIQQSGSTIVCGPEESLKADSHGNFIISL